MPAVGGELTLPRVARNGFSLRWSVTLFSRNPSHTHVLLQNKRPKFDRLLGNGRKRGKRSIRPPNLPFSLRLATYIVRAGRVLQWPEENARSRPTEQPRRFLLESSQCDARDGCRNPGTGCFLPDRRLLRRARSDCASTTPRATALGVAQGAASRTSAATFAVVGSVEELKRRRFVANAIEVR